MRPRFIIAAFGLALALVMPAVSSAATLTFNNANCSDFQVVNAGGGNVTLTCVPVVKPSAEDEDDEEGAEARPPDAGRGGAGWEGGGCRLVSAEAHHAE